MMNKTLLLSLSCNQLTRKVERCALEQLQAVDSVPAVDDAGSYHQGHMAAAESPVWFFCEHRFVLSHKRFKNRGHLHDQKATQMGVVAQHYATQMGVVARHYATQMGVVAQHYATQMGVVAQHYATQMRVVAHYYATSPLRAGDSGQLATRRCCRLVSSGMHSSCRAVSRVPCKHASVLCHR
jgi:hypothetical protein